jgi:hypothetical protein
MIHKKIISLVLFSTILLPHASKPCSLHYLPHCLIAGGILLTATQMYAQSSYHDLCERYSTVRTCILHRDYHTLRAEILRAHDRMLSGYTWQSAPYKGFPYLWYVHTISAAIDLCKTAHALTLNSTLQIDLQLLMHDLLLVRDFIITSNDYIKEQRYYTHTIIL